MYCHSKNNTCCPDASAAGHIGRLPHLRAFELCGGSCVSRLKNPEFFRVRLLCRYPYFLAAMATIYTVEPLLTRVYITNVCTAGEKVRQSVHRGVQGSYALSKYEAAQAAPELEHGCHTIDSVVGQSLGRQILCRTRSEGGQLQSVLCVCLLMPAVKKSKLHNRAGWYYAAEAAWKLPRRCCGSCAWSCSGRC
jgi:hypothetical protein